MITKKSVVRESVGVWVLSLYGLSGLTALAYEVLWMRLVSTLSGASNFGMVTTLVAFMAGLGLGSSLGARLRLRLDTALLLFAAVEMGVGIVSMLMPDVVSLLEHGFEAMAGSMGMHGWMTFHVFACVILLMLPAMALGLTFPVILRVLTSDEGYAGVSVARIYGYNTLGGVLGALIPLMLLPWSGWASALRLISSVGIMVGAAALFIAWRLRRLVHAEGMRADDAPDQPPARPPAIELMAYAGIGAAALMLEVGWMRLYGIIFMRTEYVLGVILSAVLLGIALGSFLSRRVGTEVIRILPPLAALSALLPLALLPSISAWMEASAFSSLWVSMLVQGVMMLVLTLPATVALGAWLPLIARRQDSERSAAWLYAANSSGAAIGAGLAGWVLTPWLGSSATVVVAVGLLLIGGLYWMAGRTRLLTLLIMPLMVWFWPMPTVAQLLPLRYGHVHALYHYEDAVSMTDVVATPDGVRILLNDLQRVDASSDPTAIAVQRNQGRLPLLLHPGAKRVLFLGLGTGITASAAHSVPGLKATAVELSAGSIRAAKHSFAPFNDNVSTWLDVRHDDARRFLMADRHAYDVIVGDLFHPDMAGRGMLLSLQQFERVRQRLTNTGVYVQWLALNQFDLGSLKIVLASFRKVFPHNSLFLDGFHLAMAGFRGVLPDAASIKVWANMNDGKLTGGEGWQTWIGRDIGSIPRSKAPLLDEWWPVVEFRLARAHVEGRLNVGQILAWMARVRPRPALLVKRWSVNKADSDGVVRAALSTDAMMHAWQAMFAGRSRSVSKFMQLAYQANPHDRWAGFAVADALAEQVQHAGEPGSKSDLKHEKQAWQRILDIRSDHVMALRMLWHIAKKEGDDKDEVNFLQRLRRLVPFDPEVLAAGESAGHDT